MNIEEQIHFHNIFCKLITLFFSIKSGMKKCQKYSFFFPIKGKAFIAYITV